MSPILRGATYIWLQEGTLYPLYLRALGVSIGHHAWWNRAFLRTGTELLTIGHSLHAGQMEVFLFAVEDGKGVEFAPIKLGDNCTLGQRVVIMPGVEAGDGVTVGAEGTLYSGVHVAARSTVFGSPPTVFASIADDDAQVAQLQAAVAMEEGKSGKKKETKGKQGTAPAAKVQDQARTPGLVVAAASIANIAAYPAVAALYGGFYVLIVWLPLRHTVARSPAWLALLVPAVYIAGTMVLALLLAVVARCGIANFRAGSTPFYSWRFFAWWLVAWMNDVCSGVLLYPITGTWLYTLFLTLVGAKVGSGAFMAPHGGGFREIDHMEVAEGAVVLTSGVQGHFIDHNALQFAPCRVGVGARLNTGATVMPLSSVGAETTVRAVATTIKGQMLADGGVFVGSPAAAETSGVDVALACKI